MSKKAVSVKLGVMICFVNGSYTDEPKISSFDLGLLRGLGIFDYFITYNRTPFCFSDHFARLKKNAEKIHFILPYSEKEVRAIVDQLIEKNPDQELSFRMVLTAGKNRERHFMILVDEIDRPKPHFYTSGIKLQTRTLPRYYPEIKSLFYMPSMLALNEAREDGFFDVLGLSPDGKILEATTANFFAFVNGVLITPEKDILPGVTAKIVREMAESLFPVQKTSISIKEIPSFDEAFISSTNKEILPVVQIDDQMVGTGVPGPNTRTLMEQFQKSIRPLMVSP